MRPIRVAAQIHPQQGTWDGLRRAALEAERLGYDIAYNWDHFFPLYGDREGAHFEAWSVLAAWAEATSRIEIGPLVTPIGYRNPQYLADVARTVDHIAGGRVILGLGAGWFRRDYEEYGYEFGRVGDRLGALERGMPQILHRLERLNPPPVRRPIPILIAGGGLQRTLRLVARYADGWHGGFPEQVSEMVPKVEALRRWGDAEARDPSAIEWGLGVEPEDLDRFLREDADRYLEMGFTQFTLGFGGPDWTVEAGGPWLEWRDARNRER